MSRLILIFTLLFGVFSCKTISNDLINKKERIIEDFNENWKFQLSDNEEFKSSIFDDTSWKTVNLPHDWSIVEGYQQKGDVAASTGFVPGGIGWYRKPFPLSEADKGKKISVFFEGVYNNSSVWINGQFLGKRPNGYISFAYDLTKYLKFDGTPNVIAVKVDRKAYVDSRWYTGSGIYRNVKLIKTSPLHVKQWGTKITTPQVSSDLAIINVKTELVNSSPVPNQKIELLFTVKDKIGAKVQEKRVVVTDLKSTIDLEVTTPKLWSTEVPNLYKLETVVFVNNIQVDNTTETFGIRSFKFDANKGFFLNRKSVKIKGVNIHHDAGAVGSAVPKAIWEYRVEKLKSIGVNAIRMSHNPHSPELMKVCDEMGILVMAEAFDEWFNAKDKSKLYLGDNAASKEASKAYPTVFNEWGERDLKDLIRRDFNHPSVVMWSIGNEIEWTFPYYSAAYKEINKGLNVSEYGSTPIYDPKKVKPIFEAYSKGTDTLTNTSKKLVKWVKEEDTTRPTICGSVRPSIGLTSGYGQSVDVYGFNYRQFHYDTAHKFFPDVKILGSENWGDYSEWREVVNRDFVAGIFCWTGFAYLGEAGPWPRKGLNISFFDFAGFKTPRGHLFETLWKKEPKVYMVTTPAKESEFSLKDGKWEFNMKLTPPPVWKMLRKWEFYNVNEKWSYPENEPIIVQAYVNTEEAELFLNGDSLGKQQLSSVIETDHILKWEVPYQKGELKVVGYNNGEKVDEYVLKTQEEFSEIKIKSNKTTLKANGYDVAVVEVQLVDKNGTLLTDSDTEVTFELSGPAKNLGVDNGWEMNVQPHKTNTVKTHNGKAVIFVQSQKKVGEISLKVTANGKSTNTAIKAI